MRRAKSLIPIKYQDISKAEIGRVAVLRDQATRMPGRLSRAAADWIADRRLGPQERVAVVVGFAAEPETAEAMRRAAAGALDPVGLRVRRWLDERAVASAGATRAAVLHADFLAWCAGQGLPPLGLAAFAKRLRQLGIEGALHARTRQSRFYLALREGAQ